MTDKGQDHIHQLRDPRLIYQDVQAPSQPQEAQRHSPQLVDDMESNKSTEENEDRDLFVDRLTSEKAALQKWQSKLRKCGCMLALIALVFMTCAGAGLIFPQNIGKMMERHNGHGNHHKGGKDHRSNEWAGPMRGHGGPEKDSKDHPRGPPKARGPPPPEHKDDHHRKLKHDEEFYVNKKQDKEMPSTLFKPKGHHQNGDHDGKPADGSYKVDKKMLQERRISKMVTRATFVSFLTWMFVFVAAVTGIRASKFQDNNSYIRCTFKKSVICLIIASLLGVWNLSLKFRIQKQMKQAEHSMSGAKDQWKNSSFADKKEWMSYNKFQLLDMSQKNDIKYKGEQQQVVFGRKDSRHLQAASEGRRLSSAFDVFDFVNNGISSGVSTAKTTTNKNLFSIGNPAADFIEGARTASKNTNIQQTVVVEEVQQHELQQAAPIVEEPTVQEESTSALSAEDFDKLMMFSTEEKIAMQTLADMGRLFDDEDEARMVKLTEDLTQWINKYAPSFNDPEALLFEVTGALITEEMENFVPEPEQSEEEISQPEEQTIIPKPEQEVSQPEEPKEQEVMPVEETYIQISFSFGDNSDWFTFEQTTVQSQEVEITFDFDFDNVWAEMTKGIQSFDDWGMLDNEEWDQLVQFQFMDDAELDAIIDDLVNSWVDPDFKQFMDTLSYEDTLEFTPEEIQEMLEKKTPTEFKLVLDKLEDFHEIVRIFETLTGEQVYKYFTELSDAAWKQTTIQEWQAYIVYLPSQGFKGIIDEMTTEEIMYVWQFFDDNMSSKFFDGLEMSDIYAFTQAEWEASYYGFTSTEFKQIFFDKMDTKGIQYVAGVIGDMDYFLEGLTVEDWKNFTPAEWEAFLIDMEIEDAIEFIHNTFEADSKIVYDMFKNMPKQMIEDLREAPELAEEFSEEELETIRRGIDQNDYKKKQHSEPDQRDQRGQGKKHPKPDQRGQGKKHPKPDQRGQGKKHPKPDQRGQGKRHNKQNKNTDWSDWVNTWSDWNDQNDWGNWNEWNNEWDNQWDNQWDSQWDSQWDNQWDNQWNNKRSGNQHGGRHLQRGQESQGGRGHQDKRDNFGRKGGQGQKHDGDHHNGQEGKRGGHEGKHGGHERKHGSHEGKHGGKHHGKDHKRGHNMNFCLIAGAFLYALMNATFVGIFKKFTVVFRSYHRLNKLNNQSQNMSLEERNKVYQDVNQGNRKCRQAMAKQMNASQNMATSLSNGNEQVQYSYLPPCVAPNMDGAIHQSLISNGDIEEGTPVVSAPEPRRQEATYTLDQVKRLLALEREMISRQQQ